MSTNTVALTPSLYASLIFAMIQVIAASLLGSVTACNPGYIQIGTACVLDCSSVTNETGCAAQRYASGLARCLWTPGAQPADPWTCVWVNQTTGGVSCPSSPGDVPEVTLTHIVNPLVLEPFGCDAHVGAWYQLEITSGAIACDCVLDVLRQAVGTCAAVSSGPSLDTNNTLSCSIGFAGLLVADDCPASVAGVKHAAELFGGGVTLPTPVCSVSSATQFSTFAACSEFARRLNDMYYTALLEGDDFACATFAPTAAPSAEPTAAPTAAPTSTPTVSTTPTTTATTSPLVTACTTGFFAPRDLFVIIDNTVRSAVDLDDLKSIVAALARNIPLDGATVRLDILTLAPAGGTVRFLRLPRCAATSTWTVDAFLELVATRADVIDFPLDEALHLLNDTVGIGRRTEPMILYLTAGRTRSCSSGEFRCADGAILPPHNN